MQKLLFKKKHNPTPHKLATRPPASFSSPTTSNLNDASLKSFIEKGLPIVFEKLIVCKCYFERNYYPL